MAIYDIDGNTISVSGGTAVTPVPLSTVNAMLKCAYTYIDACRAGNLVYADGTGASQREGTICCSTFCRQLLQGIPYSDYLPGNANTTSASGNRFRYGYRMLGDDFYGDDASTTAQQMYDQFEAVGRAFPTNYNLYDALPGDLIVFGSSLTTIRHIGMFVYKDSQGNNYIMDSNISERNGNLAVRVHKAYDHTAAYSNNPVGIIRPNLSETEVPTDDVPVTASNGSITGQVLNGYAHFLKVSASVTASTPVSYGDLSFTPRYTGEDFHIIPVVSTQDTTSVLSYSGVSSLTCKMSHYL